MPEEHGWVAIPTKGVVDEYGEVHSAAPTSSICLSFIPPEPDARQDTDKARPLPHA